MTGYYLDGMMRSERRRRDRQLRLANRTLARRKARVLHGQRVRVTPGGVLAQAAAHVRRIGRLGRRPQRPDDRAHEHAGRARRRLRNRDVRARCAGRLHARAWWACPTPSEDTDDALRPPRPLAWPPSCGRSLVALALLRVRGERASVAVAGAALARRRHGAGQRSLPREPTPKDPQHVSCAPEPWDGTFYWDGAEKMFFRPLSETLGLVTSGEAVNVNSLDEVPDSAWFTNRLGVRPVEPRTSCASTHARRQSARPGATAVDGSWVINQGKTSGSTPGFRPRPGKGKYLVKVEASGTGKPGGGDGHRRGRLLRGRLLRVVRAGALGAPRRSSPRTRPQGQARQLRRPLRLRPEGRRRDVREVQQARRAAARQRVGVDPRLRPAAVPVRGHARRRPQRRRPARGRRELRAARLLAAWIGNVDCREGNSLDTWIADVPGAAPDSSPGHVVHNQLGTSASLGDVWSEDELSRRFGYSYVFDWGDIATDFFTLGSVTRI